MAGGPVATWRRNTSPSCSWLSRAAFMPASPGGLPLCAFLDSVPGSVSVTHSRWPMFPDAGIRRGPAHRWGRELRACDSHPLPSASPVTLGKRLFLPVPRFSYLCNEGPFQGLPQHSHRQQMSEELRRPPPPVGLQWPFGKCWRLFKTASCLEPCLPCASFSIQACKSFHFSRNMKVLVSCLITLLE